MFATRHDQVTAGMISRSFRLRHGTGLMVSCTGMEDQGCCHSGAADLSPVGGLMHSGQRRDDTKEVYYDIQMVF